MIILKQRQESRELIVSRYINARMTLTNQEAKVYSNLEKGFAGEILFDSLLMKNLQHERFILNDLLFEKNNSIVQIDSFAISQDVLYHFEIKNIEGDHYYESDKFYLLNGNEVHNPLHQMNRSATLLRQLLRSIGCNLPLVSYVVFVNPRFMLYQAPKNQPIIYQPQLPHFFSTLNKKSSNLNSMHTNLADKLLSLHLIDNPYQNLPNYQYEQLEKGILCGLCLSLMVPIGGQKLMCQCGEMERIDSGVLRSVAEFQLLFPDKKITSTTVHDWCNMLLSKRQIARILKKNFNSKGYGQWTYYE